MIYGVTQVEHPEITVILGNGFYIVLVSPAQALSNQFHHAGWTTASLAKTLSDWKQNSGVTWMVCALSTECCFDRWLLGFDGFLGTYLLSRRAREGPPGELSSGVFCRGDFAGLTCSQVNLNQKRMDFLKKDLTGSCTALAPRSLTRLQKFPYAQLLVGDRITSPQSSFHDYLITSN